jgi:hypothetical protein
LIAGRVTYILRSGARRAGAADMIFGLIRLIGVIWIFGFIVLALVATSNYLFSSTAPDRAQRWSSRLAMALLWPIALMSSAGRDRLRRG